MPKYDVVSIVSELVSGENMVRKQRNSDALQRVDAWFTAFLFQKMAKTYAVTAVTWCNAAVDTLKSAKSYCIFSECCAGFLHFGFQFSGSMVRKRLLEI